MKKSNYKYKFLVFYCKKVLKVPILVDFTPEHMDTLYGLGLAWNIKAAERMKGNDGLAQRLILAEQKLAQVQGLALGTRKARRLANRIAKKVAQNGK